MGFFGKALGFAKDVVGDLDKKKQQGGGSKAQLKDIGDQIQRGLKRQPKYDSGKS